MPKRMFLSYIILMFTISTLIYGCNIKTKSKPNKKEPTKGSIITGMVKIEKGNLYIIENYKTRSRVDYLVKGKLKNKIYRLRGKIIEVKGKIERIGWFGSIDVEKILKITQTLNK